MRREGVAIADNNCGSVKALTIQNGLVCQSPQAIAVRLDLVGVDDPIHYGEVSPDLAAVDAQLFDHYGLILGVE